MLNEEVKNIVGKENVLVDAETLHLYASILPFPHSFQARE
jgi:hypothetical protein